MRSGFIADYYADDRAVHMLYDVPAALLGSEAAELSALKSEIIEKRDGFVGTSFEPLSEARNRDLSNCVISYHSLYCAIAWRCGRRAWILRNTKNWDRPELNDTRSASLFRKKYIEMLGKYAHRRNLKS